MSKLTELQSKLTKRESSLKKHSRAYDRLKPSQHVRRLYQRKRIQWDKKAIKKLKHLISVEQERLRKLKIDWNGHPPLQYEPLLVVIRFALNIAPGLYITATSDGVHAVSSWHYQKRAADGGSDAADNGPEKKAQQALLDKYGPGYFAELFGPLPWYVKNGVVYSGVFPGHDDHLHVAVA